MRTATLHLIAALCIAVPALAAEPRTTVVPERRGVEYDDWHYAPAVRVGDLVVISGVPAGGPGTYSEQVRRMFKTIERTLAAAGAKMEDVVEINTFHAQAKDSAAFMKEFQDFVKVHAEFFPTHYPAWTAIGGVTLLAPGAVVETKVTAYVGSGAGARLKRD
jgi:enamine deaminase RidA (YjgF/YER057c/UK114 family)